jgi:large subunit ribosomal protein L24e
MTVDTTLEFEKKRNRPLKYDRELIGTTIKAMKRIAEIKHDREARHIEARLKGKKKERTMQAIKELRQFKDVIRPPTAIKPTLLQIKAAQRVKRLQQERVEKQDAAHLATPVQKQS